MTTLQLVPLTPLPVPVPQKTDPINFAARADLFLTALPGLATETNAMITEMAKITTGLNMLAPVPAYNPATAYNFPDVVASAVDYKDYRCISAVNVTGVEPSADDGSHWVRNDMAPNRIINTNTDLLSYDVCLVTVSGVTVGLPLVAKAGDFVVVTVKDFSNTIVAHNGHLLMGVYEDMTINRSNVGVTFKFFGITHGWRII